MGLDRKHGGDLDKQFLDFSININPLGMAEGIEDRIKEKISLSVRYPDIYYADSLSLVADYYQVAVSHIFLCNGANEAIFPLLYPLRGKEIVLSCPMFEEYRHYANILEINIHNLNHLGMEEMSYVENAICYLKAHTRVKAFLLVNPNNPTGKVISKESLELLYHYCEEKKIHLIIDESFMDFLEKKEDYSLLAYLNQSHYLTIIKSLTKVYGIPGLRLGVCFTANQLAKESLTGILQPWNLSLPALIALDVIVKERPSLETTYRYIKEERQRLERILDSLGCHYEKSKTNFILVYEGQEIYEYLKKRGIFLRDCSNFEGLKSGDFRIGIQSKEKQDRLIDCLQLYKKEFNIEDNTY